MVHRRIQDEWTHVAATDERGDEREYGRLHILWLIGRSVVKLHGVHQYQEMPLSRVQQLTESMDEWFPSHHQAAVDAIAYVVDVQRGVEKRGGPQLSLRQLFRAVSYYEDFTERHDKEIQQQLTTSAGYTAA